MLGSSLESVNPTPLEKGLKYPFSLILFMSYDLVVTIALLSLSGFFAYLAMHPTEESKMLKFFFLILSLIFVWNALGSVLIMSHFSGDNLMNASSEYSQYWNCSALKGNCSGIPYQEACTTYDEEQCLRIPGCYWDVGCSGTPSVTCSWLGAFDPSGNKCMETNGCLWSSSEVAATCDRIVILYTYDRIGGYDSMSDTVLTPMLILQWVIIFMVFLFLAMLFVGVLKNLQNVVRR